MLAEPGPGRELTNERQICYNDNINSLDNYPICISGRRDSKRCIVMALYYYKIDGYIRAGDEHEAKEYLEYITNNEEIPKSWSPIKLKEIEVKEVDEEIARP